MECAGRSVCLILCAALLATAGWFFTPAPAPAAPSSRPTAAGVLLTVLQVRHDNRHALSARREGGRE
jgi:4-hydroxybenzoate polyprenyltransferase